MVEVDVVVVGLGAWGSSALWRLAERGLRVVGFDAQDVPNALGSSHGYTRLFRVACHEHVELPWLARRSAELLRELERHGDDRLLDLSGLLSIGPPEGKAIKITAQAIERAKIDARWLTLERLREDYPQHAGLGDDYVGIFDAEAGSVAVEESIRAAIARAVALGAEVHTKTAVVGVDESGGGVVVRTETGTVTAKQVVLAGGAWMSKLQDFVPLTVYRGPLLLWQAQQGHEEEFDLARFPAFIRHYDPVHTLWGHGRTSTCPVKIGAARDRADMAAIDPDRVKRSVSPREDWGHVADVLSWAIPGVDGQPVEVAPCMTTDSPDRQFVIGRWPGREKVILAGGCSAHGFKHATGIGELISQIAVDETPFMETDFLSPQRFL